MLDGLAAAVRAKLGVEPLDMGLDGVLETYSSLAISGTDRLVGR